MSQHGYMRHTATPPLVLEIGQKLCSEAYNLTTPGRRKLNRIKTLGLYVQNQYNMLHQIQRCELAHGKCRASKQVFHAFYFRVQHFHVLHFHVLYFLAA